MALDSEGHQEASPAWRHRLGVHHPRLRRRPARHGPSIFDEAVFSEYGWQGGKPLLVYNGVLLVVATVAAVGLRKTLEGRIAITWFALLWVLSVVHLIEGLRHIPVLSLLSYTLYSMALHAFHVPLAVLVAWWMSPHTALTPVDEDAMPVRGAPPVVTSVLLGLVVLGAIAAQTVAFILADKKIVAVSPKLALREALEGVERAVYTENMHWGYIWGRRPALGRPPSQPSGWFTLTPASAAATQAMFYDNTSYFIEHDMLHA